MTYVVENLRSIDPVLSGQRSAIERRRDDPAQALNRVAVGVLRTPVPGVDGRTAPDARPVLNQIQHGVGVVVRPGRSTDQ
jgi:hypothetical protein